MRDQIANIHWSIRKAKEFQKTTTTTTTKPSTSASLDYTKAFDSVDYNKLNNSSRVGNTRPPNLPPEKSMHIKKRYSESDMEQWTGSRVGKEVKAYIVTLLI